MLTPYAAFNVFVTTKLHFQGKIDVKTRGLFLHNLTEHSLNKRTDRWAFVALARAWDDPVALSTYLAAEWAVHEPPSWSGQVIESASCYQGAQVRRNKVLSAPEVYMKKTIEQVAAQCSFDRLVSGREPRTTIKLIQSGPEVFVLFNKALDGKITRALAANHPQFKAHVGRIERYAGFVPSTPSVLQCASELMNKLITDDAQAEAEMRESVQDLENAQMGDMLRSLV